MCQFQNPAFGWQNAQMPAQMPMQMPAEMPMQMMPMTGTICHYHFHQHCHYIIPVNCCSMAPTPFGPGGMF
ncbi:MAG: hypothetical protein Q8920_01950 [Bacillota bacterium]|nr:hypothetical protein [Bacillota bacterium]